MSNVYTVLSGPWFDLTGSGNVTGVSGRNSHLACRVKNLANQTVSQQKVLSGVTFIVKVFPVIEFQVRWQITSKTLLSEKCH